MLEIIIVYFPVCLALEAMEEALKVEKMENKFLLALHKLAVDNKDPEVCHNYYALLNGHGYMCSQSPFTACI